MDTNGGMGPMERPHEAALLDLNARTFEGLGCIDHGIVVLRGADSWHAHERGYLELPIGTDMARIPVAHDERGGPYATNGAGQERTDFLFSLTDEKGCIACAWAIATPESPLMGVGIDLCAERDFLRTIGSKRRRTLEELLLTDEERAIAPTLDASTYDLSRAALFAAKEAAFKATAAPLRRWYDTHDERLRFEVRHFVAHEWGTELGTGRNGAAQRAMNLMGIRRIKVEWAEVADMALVTAVALKAEA